MWNSVEYINAIVGLREDWGSIETGLHASVKLPHCPLLPGTLSVGQSSVDGSSYAIFPWSLLSPPSLPNRLPRFLLLDPAVSLTLSSVPFPMLHGQGIPLGQVRFSSFSEVFFLLTKLPKWQLSNWLVAPYVGQTYHVESSEILSLCPHSRRHLCLSCRRGINVPDFLLTYLNVTPSSWASHLPFGKLIAVLDHSHIISIFIKPI